jgi:protein-S-isoprenylcysteine O-methyltransferase Ste14
MRPEMLNGVESGPVQAWRAVAASYARLAAKVRGGIWLNKLAPAYLFGVVAALKGWSLAGTGGRLVAGPSDLLLVLVALNQASSTLFFGMISALYLIRRQPLQRVDSTLQVVVALTGAYVMLPVAFSGTRADNPFLLLLSDLLLIVGIGGAVIALASLGRCFGIFPEARGLVTRGAYRLVRHPMYLFEFIAFLGILLIALTPTNIVLYLVFVAAQLWRMTFEERTLRLVFPGEYAAYCQRTARLIPGLY